MNFWNNSWSCSRHCLFADGPETLWRHVEKKHINDAFNKLLEATQQTRLQQTMAQQFGPLSLAQMGLGGRQPAKSESLLSRILGF